MPKVRIDYQEVAVPMKKARIFRLRTALVIVIYISVSFVAEGQIVTGSIVGRALDPSGAVMPEVKVSLININTQLTRTVVTNSSGELSSLTFLPESTLSA